MTASTLPLAPETPQVPGAGATAESAPSEYWPWAAPVPATAHPDARFGHDPGTVATARRRAQDPDYPDWLGHVSAAAGCRHPIRLIGQIEVNNRGGERMAVIDTDSMPDGAIYTPCGNRRAAVCPSCAETYRRDTYHLIAAGLRGDRWGLPPLGHHIAVFLTATAPSFGAVHHRVVKTHAADCRTKTGCTCRAAVCHPFGRACPHGQPTRCTARHRAGDSSLGQPLCLDCYDHQAQVVWHHEAAELWRRTIQEADRDLKRLARRHGVDLRRRYVKVYEFQTRGVIHYHALIRLDGYHPDCPAAIVPPPAVITRQMLADVLADAFRRTAFTSAPHPANGGRGWHIRWGDQLDLRHVNAPGGEVNLAQVTGYLAKYTTKSTEATGHTVGRLTDLTADIHGDPATHVGRLIRACWTLGAQPDWHRLRRWAHQYGYGGHITTKSRAFSVTYGFIRAQRTIWRRTQGHPETYDHEAEADLVVYRLGYHATGWITTGDALLANTAAAQARARAWAARDALDEQRRQHAPIALPTAA